MQHVACKSHTVTRMLHSISALTTSASEQVIGEAGNLNLHVTLHARFTLNMLLSLQVLQRNMLSLCVYYKTFFFKLHDKLSNMHSARLL